MSESVEKELFGWFTLGYLELGKEVDKKVWNFYFKIIGLNLFDLA